LFGGFPDTTPDRGATFLFAHVCMEVCMSRVNVYLPDELAHEWRTAGRTNLSQITQNAIRRELARWDTDMWLRRVTVQRGWNVSHQEVLGALLEDAATAGGDA
jgi:post-segregation antitoxin (ccd killing protein)